MRHKRLPPSGLAAPQAPVNEPLERLLPLVISECSRGEAVAGQRALFDALLHQHHYLGHRSSVGENLQYLVGDTQGRPLACVLFGAAAWQCASRDRYIGWDGCAAQTPSAHRQQHAFYDRALGAGGVFGQPRFGSDCPTA